MSDQPEHRLSGSKTPARSGSRGEPTRTGKRIDLAETVKLISTGLLPAEIRRLFGFPWDRAREALLQSTVLQLRGASACGPMASGFTLPPGQSQASATAPQLDAASA